MNSVRKYFPRRKVAGHPRYLFLFLFPLLLPVSGHADAFRDKASICAKKMGKVPELDCMKDGSIVPNTVDGQRVVGGAEVKACDHPQLFNGKCYPHSRVIMKTIGDITISVFCRRTKFDAEETENFDDIAVIQYDSKNKEACFFQSFAGGAKVKIPYGEDEPNPINEKKLPKWGMGGGCMSCHSGSIWIRSPYVAQLKDKNAVPWDPFPGVIKNAAHSDEETAAVCINSVAYDATFPPTDEEKAEIKAGRMVGSGKCTSCHQTGNKDYYDSLVKPSIAETRQEHLTKTAKAFPKSHWMPPSLSQIKDEKTGSKRAIKDGAEFLKVYSRALAAIRYCGTYPEKKTKEGVPLCRCDDEKTSAPITPATPHF